MDARAVVERYFGASVRTARESRNWSQEKLAKELRDKYGLVLHQTALARLENGQRAIRLSEAMILASVLDIDIKQATTAPFIDSEDEYQKSLDFLKELESAEAAATERRNELIAQATAMHHRIAEQNSELDALYNESRASIATVEEIHKAKLAIQARIEHFNLQRSGHRHGGPSQGDRDE